MYVCDNSHEMGFENGVQDCMGIPATVRDESLADFASDPEELADYIRGRWVFLL